VAGPSVCNQSSGKKDLCGAVADDKQYLRNLCGCGTQIADYFFLFLLRCGPNEGKYNGQEESIKVNGLKT